MIYLSKSKNIFMNLALENYLFNNVLNTKPMLFLYVNEPSVVIGRAQNPWVECNLLKLNADDVNLARRQSGGGAVYHDLGNLNFCFLLPNNLYNKKDNLKIITNSLLKFGIETKISDRNDITVDYYQKNYKITGCAFRETKNKSFHHGTLLINTNLSKLKEYVHHKIDKTISAKGVSSVRSKVINLSEISNKITIKESIKSISTQFQKFFYNNLTTLNILETCQLETHELVMDNYTKLSSYDWKYSKTLPFSLSFSNELIDNLTLNIKNNIVVSYQVDKNITEIKLLLILLDSLPEFKYNVFKSFFNQKLLNITEKNILNNILKKIQLAI